MVHHHCPTTYIERQQNWLVADTFQSCSQFYWYCIVASYGLKLLMWKVLWWIAFFLIVIFIVSFGSIMFNEHDDTLSHHSQPQNSSSIVSQCESLGPFCSSSEERKIVLIPGTTFPGERALSAMDGDYSCQSGGSPVAHRWCADFWLYSTKAWHSSQCSPITDSECRSHTQSGKVWVQQRYFWGMLSTRRVWHQIPTKPLQL